MIASIFGFVSRKSGFNTTLTNGQTSAGVTTTGSGVTISFNEPLPSGDPLPQNMRLYVSSTEIDSVDFNLNALGIACAVSYSGNTYLTTFQNNNHVVLT